MMKKLINDLSVACLLLSFIFSLSCGGDEEVKPIVDYRCKVTTRSNAERIYCNTPVPISVEIDKKDPGVGNYIFNYTVISGDGDLVINNSKLNSGEDVSINLNNFTAQFIPRKLGEHKLKFRFKNEEYITESLYVIQANDLVFEASAANLPKKLLIDKSIAFDLQLKQKNEDSEATEFNAQLQILKGKGYVTFVGAEDTTSLLAFSAKSDSIITRAGGIVTRAVSDSRIKLGNNKVHFKSAEEGENVILLSVENEWGYKQDLNVPLNIELPEFSVRTTADSTGSVGTVNNFLLNIEDTDNYGENTYSITYRNLRNSGKLKINNNEIQVGATLLLQKGDNVCEFTPTSLGETSLEFIVKDKFNTTKKDTVSFNAKRSYVDISVSDYEETTTIYNTRDFSFSVSKKDYTGKYFLDLSQTPAGTASVKINGTDYAGGRLQITNTSNTLVSFVPKVTGNFAFKLKVYDDYNSESVAEVPFKVANSTGSIKVSNYTPSLTIFSPSLFNFSINKPNYKGTYRYEIAQLSSNEPMLPVNSGSLKVNGKEYKGGITTVENSNNTMISFTPEKKGEVTLRIRVYDDFGGEMSEDLAFSISNTDIKLSVVDLDKNILLAKESSFTFTPTKPFYDGKNLSFIITQEPGTAGLLRVNGQTYLAGEMGMASNNTPVKVSFTPTAEGNVSLLLKVYDEWGGNVLYPVAYNVTNPPIRIDYINFISAATFKTENSFYFNVSKDNYTDGFKYNIATSPASAGEIRIDDAPYNGGTYDLKKPSSTKLSFIPNVTGNVTLSLSITDQTGATIKRELNYRVENPELKLSVGAMEDNLTLNKKSSFNFSVSKTNYSGKIFLELESENCKDIRINNAAYTSGKNELITPSGTQISFIPTCVGKDTVKLTIKISDEWGKSESRKLAFSVTNSDISLEVNNVENSLFIGRETKFNFIATKPSAEKLKFEIKASPANLGTFKVSDVPYISGQHEIAAGISIPVTFIPSKEGSTEVRVIITDSWGGEKSKTFTYTIGSTPIVMEITDFVSEATLNQESIFTMALAKQYYTGGYNYSIVTTPSQAGTIKVNDEVYKGGRLPVTDPKNTKITFIPQITDNVALKINVTDNIGGEQTKTLTFKVVNNPISVIVSNQEVGLTVNKETNFNFAVSKKNYSGKFQFELVTEPAAVGKFKVNGTDYTGGRTDIGNINNTRITFNPTQVGDIKLFLKVYDDFNGEISKELAFAVSNSETQIVVSNQEPEIIYNTPATFNFAVVKQNYSGSYKYEIIQDPEAAGILKVNGTAYPGGQVALATPASTIVEFTSTQAGKNVLTLKVYDEIGGSTEKNIIFNVTNPELKLEIKNHTPDVLVHTASAFNFNVSKADYSGTFKCQIEQIPAASGTISIGGKAYDGTKITLTANSNAVTFTPTRTGSVTLDLTVEDEWGTSKTISVPFSVANTDISINVTNKEQNLILNRMTTLNFSVSKPNYSGSFKAKIVQDPASSGSVRLNSSVISDNTPVAISANNTLEFTPTETGAVLLKLIISDDLNGEKEIALNFNVVNPEIDLTLNGPGSKTMSIGQSTTFTIKAAKEGYSGAFNYEITPYPVDCGTLSVNGKTGLTGALSPNPSTVSFTPNQLGTAIFTVKVTDTEGKSSEKNIDFSVVNTPVEISFANNEANAVLNNPTDFVFKVTKANYPDSKNITYTISPAYTGTLVVDGKAYTGTSTSIPYSRIKNGINISYSPDREGQKGLTFVAEDEFGGMDTKSLIFSVSNPELRLYLTGVNTGAANEATLGSTYKFYYNINKDNYKDEFSYWITLDPQAVGIVGTSDVTPRNARSGGGVDIQTGTIQANPNGATTGEIRFTPSNADYLNQEVAVNVRIRDKWNNEKEQTVKFKVVTSAIELNVSRKTSIPVEEPYTFYFTVNKQGYSGTFKYSLVGWADGDKLEVSADNSSWTTYSGGKFDLPNKDHTYIRYTPAAINTIPLRLFVYDNQNGEAMQELTFDVKAPEVKLTTDAIMKSGYLNEFVPFTLTATEDKAENLNVSFSLDDPSFSGELKFNDNAVTPTSSRTRAAASSFSIASGSANKLEIKSNRINTWGVTTTATNRWQQSASVTTSVQIADKPNYTLTTSQTGEGKVNVKASDNSDGPSYKEGSVVTITATPASGWRFAKWTGDVTGTSATATVTMNADKNVQAEFEKSTCYVYASVAPNGTPGNNCYYTKGKIKITEVKTGKIVSEINQNEWVHYVLSTNSKEVAYISSDYLVEYELYFSKDGVNAVTSGTLSHRGTSVTLGSGGIVKFNVNISPSGPGKSDSYTIYPNYIK